MKKIVLALAVVVVYVTAWGLTDVYSVEGENA